MHIKSSLATANYEQHAAGCDRAQQLSGNVRKEIFSGKAPAHPETDRNRRVQMTARDVSDGKSHRQNRQTKSQRHACEADPNIRERRGQHGTAATSQDEPERADELRCEFFHLGVSFVSGFSETFYSEIYLSARIIW